MSSVPEPTFLAFSLREGRWLVMMVRGEVSARVGRRPRGVFLSRMIAGVLSGVAMATVVPAGSAEAAAVPSVAAASAFGRPLRVMPLGDSITAGVGSPSRSSYRTDLRRRLAGAGVAVDFVGSQRSGPGPDPDHEGHGGWTIDRISRHLDGWLATYRPDIVLVHLGTNNVTRGEAAPVIAAKLSALVDQIRVDLPASRIVVSTIIGSKVRAELTVDRAYNALIPGVVAGKDARVALADQSTVQGIDLLDLHHPNDFGYAKMAYTYYRTLAAILPAGRAWPAGTNPHRLRSAVRCLWRPVQRAGRTANLTECRRWTMREVQRRIGGVDRSVQRWQTRRPVARVRTVTVNGRRVTTTHLVNRWFGAEDFLRF
jgi:lysophospholipase L1-like esterase